MEFKELFTERQKSFFAQIINLCQGKKVSWEVYNYEFEFGAEDMARPDHSFSPSNDLDELITYGHFLTGQGFRVELVVSWSIDSIKMIIVGWEGQYEPEWPEHIRQDFLFRWNGVRLKEEMEKI